MAQESARLYKILKENNIKGAIILITENGKNVRLMEACNGIHKLNITKGLSNYILKHENQSENNWSVLIQNAAETISIACDMIADLTKDD